MKCKKCGNNLVFDRWPENKRPIFKCDGCDACFELTEVNSKGEPDDSLRIEAIKFYRSEWEKRTGDKLPASPY